MNIYLFITFFSLGKDISVNVNLLKIGKNGLSVLDNGKRASDLNNVQLRVI
ncbi:hypothetical protein [Butyrivibrio sp. AE3003]|uniref:hypothetical protein n=1 Tax=Butyrivibrio sp. AE3003 TaxID=1496721 RepID=UPI001FA73A1E|nr:hypothetical protein [Butyrivibrio sp. AE3003]